MAVTGTTNLDSLGLSGGLTVGSNVTITGALVTTGGEFITGSLAISTGLSVGSNATVAGTFSATGNANLLGTTIIGTDGSSQIHQVYCAIQRMEAPDTATSVYQQFRQGGVAKGYIGVAASTSVIVADGAGGETFIRTQAKDMRISVDSGTTSAVVIKGGCAGNTLQISSSNVLILGNTAAAQTHTIATTPVFTVGSNGTAAAMTTPVGYMPITVGSLTCKVALFNI